MSSTTVMRVHGHAVEVEFLFQGKLVMWRNAWSNFFQESGNKKVNYWFHISIPTLIQKDVLGNPVNPTLKKIFIDYTCDRSNASVYIDLIHIFDGNTDLNSKNPIFEAKGKLNHNEKEWDINITPQPTISKGLGISVNVVFAEPGGTPERSIEFHAVGAEFETPTP